MYGEPLQPNRCKFDLGIFDGIIQIFIIDLDEESNDDVRDVVHPDFERYWSNDMENIFSTDHFKTMQEAKDWCISIGMIFGEISEESEVKDEAKTLSKYDKYSNQELRNMLKKSIETERFEESAIINVEINKRKL